MSSKDNQNAGKTSNTPAGADAPNPPAGAGDRVDGALVADVGAQSPIPDGPGMEADRAVLEQYDPENTREAFSRDGVIKRLGEMPGHECHAIQARLAECLPFFPGAIESCQGSVLGDALMHLEGFLRGEVRP